MRWAPPFEWPSWIHPDCSTKQAQKNGSKVAPGLEAVGKHLHRATNLLTRRHASGFGAPFRPDFDYWMGASSMLSVALPSYPFQGSGAQGLLPQVVSLVVRV